MGTGNSKHTRKMSRRSMLRAALILASIHAQTPPPASDPPAEPSPPACADDATWHKKDDTAKNCQWVSELLPTRCEVHGDSQTAQEACKKSCDSCEEGLEPPRRSTFAPTNIPSEEEECRTDICAFPETSLHAIDAIRFCARRP